VATGWFAAGDTEPGVRLEQIDVQMTTCDVSRVARMLPLGLFWSDAGPLWAAQMAGAARERYVLMLWTGTRAREALATGGGHCPDDE
jgi:hypothetical protein